MSQDAPVIAVNIPTTVEAWQWDGSAEQGALIVGWIIDGERWAMPHPYEDRIILDHNVDAVKPGQWVIRDKYGDFWPISDADYRATFQSPVLR